MQLTACFGNRMLYWMDLALIQQGNCPQPLLSAICICPLCLELLKSQDLCVADTLFTWVSESLTWTIKKIVLQKIFPSKKGFPHFWICSICNISERCYLYFLWISTIFELHRKQLQWKPNTQLISGRWNGTWFHSHTIPLSHSTSVKLILVVSSGCENPLIETEGNIYYAFKEQVHSYNNVGAYNKLGSNKIIALHLALKGRLKIL